MKRIIVTLAALTISSVGFAENLDSYASVLKGDPAPFIEYSAKSEAGLDSHGDVLLDPVPQGSILTREYGIGAEIGVGAANSTLFDTDAESAF